MVRNSAVRPKVSPTARPASRARYARYRVISQACPHGVSGPGAGWGASFHLQAVMGAYGGGIPGRGLIFVRRDSVRGLTTAAAIWVTAAIGSAAGAGLPLLAVLATGIYFLVAVAFPVVTRRLPRSATAISALRVRYPDGHGILRNVLREATTRGFAIDDVATEALGYRRPPGQAGTLPEPRMVEVTLHVHGKNSVNELAAALSEQQDVDAVLATDVNATGG